MPTWLEATSVIGLQEESAPPSMTTNPVSKGEPCELDLSSMTVEEGLELIETERVRPLLKYLRTGVEFGLPLRYYDGFSSN